MYLQDFQKGPFFKMKKKITDLPDCLLFRFRFKNKLTSADSQQHTPILVENFLLRVESTF